MKFTASEVLQASTGFFFTGNVGDIYKVLNCASGQSLLTHQLLIAYEAFQLWAEENMQELSAKDMSIKALFDKLEADVKGKTQEEKELICKELKAEIEKMFPYDFEIQEGCLSMEPIGLLDGIPKDNAAIKINP